MATSWAATSISADLGAVVVKSLSAEPWAGNPAPRLHETAAGLLNSVGLQNPGVEAWLEHELPTLAAAGARVVASIWGFSSRPTRRPRPWWPRRAGRRGRRRGSQRELPQRRGPPAHVRPLAGRHRRGRGRHRRRRPAAVGQAQPQRHRPARDRRRRAVGAGADALTLVNTVMGLAIDPDTRQAPARRAAAAACPARRSTRSQCGPSTRCTRPCPTRPSSASAASAPAPTRSRCCWPAQSAIQVGTATFADPRAPARVLQEMANWCDEHGVRAVRELVGAAHG